VRQYGGIYDDPELGAYVALVGARLLAGGGEQGKEYTFSILDSDIPNAFALPGGYAYVTRGMLTLINTEAELAGVMGHEIGHVIARHSAQRQTGNLIAGLLAGAIGALTRSADIAQFAGILGQGALAQYSQSQEYEADALGVRFMRAGGWNPLGAADMLSALQRRTALEQARFGAQGGLGGDFFASHPNTLQRVGRAVELARQAGATGDYGRDAWLRHIDGMYYDGSPQAGYIRGRQFVHTGLRIQFTAPPGWTLINAATAVAARSREGTLVFDHAKDQVRFSTPRQYLTSRFVADATFDEIREVVIDGLPAAIGSARVPVQGGAQAMLLAAIRHADGQYYRFRAAFKSRDVLPAIGQSILSFRRLSDYEARSLKPWRIRVVQVGPNDTIASLSRQMVIPEEQEAIFRMINALDAGATLRPGELVKLVLQDR
jgi:predicted Zn-dependent protease